MKYIRDMSQLSLLVHERKAEDDKDVRFIMRSLIEDQYTNDRLEQLLDQANKYEKVHRGSRANRNVISAVQLLINQHKTQNPCKQQI